MQEHTLSYLLDIHVEGPLLSIFSADRAVKVWWRDCSTTRRVRQRPRKAYCPREKASTEADTARPQSDTGKETVTLCEWDSWLYDGTDSDGTCLCIVLMLLFGISCVYCKTQPFTCKYQNWVIHIFPSVLLHPNNVLTMSEHSQPTFLIA